jgi:hypothetical protein
VELIFPKEGMVRNFSPKKSESFGQERTCGLGYQRPACVAGSELEMITLLDMILCIRQINNNIQDGTAASIFRVVRNLI